MMDRLSGVCMDFLPANPLFLPLLAKDGGRGWLCEDDRPPLAPPYQVEDRSRSFLIKGEDRNRSFLSWEESRALKTEVTDTEYYRSFHLAETFPGLALRSRRLPCCPVCPLIGCVAVNKAFPLRVHSTGWGLFVDGGF